MSQPNVDLIQRTYAAYMGGDAEQLKSAFRPDVRWHVSGFDPNARTYEGIDDVLGYLFAPDHLDDYALEVIDILSSVARVAVVARTSGSRGGHRIVNDYVQLIRIDDGRIGEVWNYNWDQKAIAELWALPA